MVARFRAGRSLTMREGVGGVDRVRSSGREAIKEGERGAANGAGFHAAILEAICAGVSVGGRVRGL